MGIKVRHGGSPGMMIMGAYGAAEQQVRNKRGQEEIQRRDALNERSAQRQHQAEMEQAAQRHQQKRDAQQHGRQQKRDAQQHGRQQERDEWINEFRNESMQQQRGWQEEDIITRELTPEQRMEWGTLRDGDFNEQNLTPEQRKEWNSLSQKYDDAVESGEHDKDDLAQIEQEITRRRESLVNQQRKDLLNPSSRLKISPYPEGQGPGEVWEKDGFTVTRDDKGNVKKLGETKTSQPSFKDRQEAWKLAMDAAKEIDTGVNMEKARKIYNEIMGAPETPAAAPGGAVVEKPGEAPQELTPEELAEGKAIPVEEEAQEAKDAEGKAIPVEEEVQEAEVPVEEKVNPIDEIRALYRKKKEERWERLGWDKNPHLYNTNDGADVRQKVAGNKQLKDLVDIIYGVEYERTKSIAAEKRKIWDEISLGEGVDDETREKAWAEYKAADDAFELAHDKSRQDATDARAKLAQIALSDPRLTDTERKMIEGTEGFSGITDYEDQAFPYHDDIAILTDYAEKALEYQEGQKKGSSAEPSTESREPSKIIPADKSELESLIKNPKFVKGDGSVQANHGKNAELLKRVFGKTKVTREEIEDALRESKMENYYEDMQ